MPIKIETVILRKLNRRIEATDIPCVAIYGGPSRSERGVILLVQGLMDSGGARVTFLEYPGQRSYVGKQHAGWVIEHYNPCVCQTKILANTHPS